MATIAEALAVGLARHQAGQRAAAEQIYRQILDVEPRQPDALHLLGVLALEAGQPKAAIDWLQQAIRAKAGAPAFHNNLGEAFRAAGLLDEAVTSYQRALKLQRDFAEAHNNLGNALSEQGKPDEAIASYRQALKRKPRYAEAHNNLGSVLQEQGKLVEAIASFRRALDARPDYAKAHFNLGTALREQGQPVEAVTSYQRAIELKSDYAEAYNNLGNALVDIGQLDEAEAGFRRALALKPNFEEAHVSLAIVLLLRGDWQHGWAEYQHRLRVGEHSKRRADDRPWNGEPLGDKTILLYAEQGLGDTIQFARFASILKRQGARVIVECQRVLLPLLQSCPGVDQWVARGDAPPPFDVQAALMSVPGMLKITLENIPAEVPYLRADAALVERWSETLSGVDGLKVGVHWQGSRNYHRDLYRSIAPRHFAPLAQLPGVRWVSLQKDADAQALAGLGFPVMDLGDDWDQAAGAFMDTAAVMRCLDLVITSDSAVAHLAGALGVPVWVALSWMPDWRWLLNRADSPWYPTMRLFRQSALHDWDGVFERIRAALAEHVCPA